MRSGVNENRYRIREAVTTRLLPDPPPRPQGPEPPALLHRRRLLLGVATSIAATAAGAVWWRGSSGLPEPSSQAVGPEYLAATLKLKPAPRAPMPPTLATSATCVAGAPLKGLADLDLVLAIDTTGSMGGVINDVKANARQLIETLRAGGGMVRVGVVAYRDSGDDYVVRSFPLTVLDSAGVAALDSFIAALRANGGGDWPEKLDTALDAATAMVWRGDVAASIVVIADAPAHPRDQASALAIAEAFATKIFGGQVSVVDTGSGGHAFLRALTTQGGGQYVTYDGHLLNSLFPAITGCPSH
jgi:Mg-chelatase subunit ChlD